MDSAIQNTSTIINGVVLDSPSYAYDILHQNLVVLTTDGINYITLADIDAYYKAKILITAFMAIRVGSSSVAAVLFFLLVKDRKRPIYICNMISLLCLFLHSSLFIQTTANGFSLISTNLTQSYVLVSKNDRNVFAVVSFIQLILVISIEVSLVLQVRSVFPQKTLYRVLVTCLIVLVAIATTIINLLSVIPNMVNALHDTIPLFSQSFFGRNTMLFSQLSLLISVFITSLVLSGKLLYAFRSRKVLGLRQFGPLEIVFIMAVQTMVLPVIMSVINFTINFTTAQGLYVSGFSAFTPLLIVLSLPMSALWASTTNPNSNSSSNSASRSLSRIRNSNMHNQNGNGGNDSNGSSSKSKVQQSFSSISRFQFFKKSKTQTRTKNITCNSGQNYDLETQMNMGEKYTSRKTESSRGATQGIIVEHRGISSPNPVNEHVAISLVQTSLSKSVPMPNSNSNGMVTLYSVDSFKSINCNSDICSPSTCSSSSDYVNHETGKRFGSSKTLALEAGQELCIAGSSFYKDSDLFSLYAGENEEEYYNRIKLSAKWSLAFIYLFISAIYYPYLLFICIIYYLLFIVYCLLFIIYFTLFIYWDCLP